MFLTYKYRLLPSKRQHALLRDLLESQRQLYNAALESRMDFYRKFGRSLSLFDQFKELTVLRQDPEFKTHNVQIQRGTLARLDNAFKSFFKRLKAGQAPGFPRFKGRDWFDTVTFAAGVALNVNGNRLSFSGFPSSLRVHFHRPLPKGKIASGMIGRDAKGWFVCFQVEVQADEPLSYERKVGLDLGLTNFIQGSDGLNIPSPRIARKAHDEMRRKQRALARCQKGTNRRRKIKAVLSKTAAKIANTRKTFLHQVSEKIARLYDFIAIEDLKVKNMMKNGNLARSIADASWSTFTQMLSYKAERAGGKLVKVDPKYTSQDCAFCGERVPKGLSVRVHSCTRWPLTIDRDLNAAINILNKAVVGLGLHNVTAHGERAAGNLS